MTTCIFTESSFDEYLRDKKPVEVGVYVCAQKHTFEVSDGSRLSPFESKPCPKCNCAAGLQHVYTK